MRDSEESSAPIRDTNLAQADSAHCNGLTMSSGSGSFFWLTDGSFSEERRFKSYHPVFLSVRNTNTRLLNEPSSGVRRTEGFFYCRVVRAHGASVQVGDPQWESIPDSMSCKAFARLTIICKSFWILMLWMSITSVSFAQIDVSSNSFKAVNAILGEAEGEPYLGKVALGEALRNRGTFRGVYGLSSPRLSKASARVRAECEKAWRESGTSSLVSGADVWGTDSDVKKFRKTKWFKSYKFVRKIGSHSFFKLNPRLGVHQGQKREKRHG